MSVQAGEWNFDGEPVGRERLSRISHTIMEYGPDGESMHVLGNMGILYRAFHTTPHSRLETQPHVCDDGVVITWDGRLDNRAELIAQLRGSVDAASTDVAIVAAAFRKAGVRSFSQLIGDWALSIWNPRELELILARDYIGVRHLFYHLTHKRITWCSLMSPLVLSGECFTLCNEYIAGYLSFYPDADLTPYSEIRSVPPGKFIRVHDGNTTVGNHWKFSPGLKTRCKTDAEYEEQYRCLFGQAVRRRLYSDSVILAELSGGLDSSAIVCMADELSKQQPANAPRIDTFSYFDCDEPYEDDHRYFIKVEEQRGRTGHHAAIRGTGDTFPISCSRFVPTPGFGERLEIQSARKDIVDRHKYRVVLSGQGGDEVNGQALDVRVQIADCLARFHFSKGGSQLLKWCLDTKYPLIHLLGESLSLLLPRQIRVGTNVANVWPWINSDFARQYSLASRALTAAEGKWFWKPSVRDAYQTIINFGREVTFHRPTVPEKRYPYLDQTLVEFLLSIPTDQVLRPANRRSLMRRALSHLLPSEILHRRSKAGTGRCIAFTVTKHWTEVHNLLVSPISSRLHIIDEAALRAQMESIKHGQLPTRVAGLLKVLSLEVWLRNAEAHGVLSPSTSASARAEPYLSESIAS
jgi:asparagine synthase (glutamine-hydrolysing)